MAENTMSLCIELKHKLCDVKNSRDDKNIEVNKIIVAIFHNNNCVI